MQLVYRWLGLEPSMAEAAVSISPENVTPEIIEQPSFFGIPQRLWNFTALRNIAPYLPAVIRERAKRLTSTLVDRRTVDSSPVLDLLRPIQRRQTEDLSDMIGRDFPEWTTLFETSQPQKMTPISDEVSAHA
jgi:hypothetical protein